MLRVWVENGLGICWKHPFLYVWGWIPWYKWKEHNIRRQTWYWLFLELSIFNWHKVKRIRHKFYDLDSLLVQVILYICLFCLSSRDRSREINSTKPCGYQGSGPLVTWSAPTPPPTPFPAELLLLHSKALASSLPLWKHSNWQNKSNYKESNM